MAASPALPGARRLVQMLKIQPGEGRLAALVIGVMALTAAGSSLGGTGIEALFFARFGVENLPYLYMVLGTVSFLTSLVITAGLGRVRRERLYTFLPLGMAAVLVLAWALLALEWRGLYPALWLGKEVLNSLIGLVVWGVAGAVCDTRQAKRLFPLFGAGRILGQVIGGLATGGLVARLGTESLLLVWAGAMVLTFWLSQRLLGGRAMRSPATARRVRRAQPGLIAEVQRGYQFVRQSPLMQWTSVAAVLFSVLYFSIALPFSKATTAQYPDEAALAGFLGLFNGVSTAVAFLTSLLAANRLYARFGILRCLLALPVIYLIGFGLLTVWAAFPLIVAFRLAQMVWLMGIADAAYQALFNAVPAERRDQVRAFIGGVPEQAGTFLAGALLVVGEQALPSQWLYVIGLLAAAATTAVIWRAGRAYASALAAVLRAGQPQVFATPDEAPFSGVPRDATAARVALDALTHPEAGTRRIAAEVVGGLPGPQAAAALVRTLGDEAAEVRVTALRALARAGAADAMLEVAARLHDPEPEVRGAAIDALRRLAPYPGGLVALLQPRLDDAAPMVRAAAAAAILRVGPHPRARDLLRSMAMLGELEARVAALTALGAWGDVAAADLLATEAADLGAPPAIRRAAVRALAGCGATAIDPLAGFLGDPDRGLREAAAAALGQLGAPASGAVLAALADPAREIGALAALERLPAPGPAEVLRRYAQTRLASALRYHGYRLAVQPAADDRLRLLADSLQERAQAHGLCALRALRLLGDPEAYTAAIDNLDSREPAQRAYVLEMLETVREAPRLRPLLPVWDPTAAAQAGSTAPLAEVAGALLADADPWLRACAVLAIAHLAEAERALLAQRALGDPADFVRATAAALLSPGEPMNTLSLMARVLFLRRVPLFADLAPAELQQVAVIAAEEVFAEGDLLAVQGELGEAMFIIVSGEVAVRVAADGRPETEVARRVSGEVVGEMSIISGEPRMASLLAIGDVRTLCLDRKSFEAVLRERPEVCLAVMRQLCARLREGTR